MNNLNTIAIDLAKNVFQVGVFSPQHKMQSNKQFSRQKLAPFMAQQGKAIVVMEACYSSHYWA
ncbi:MAG: IS110 family transposase, partial [Paraglaciecola sp.]